MTVRRKRSHPHLHPAVHSSSPEPLALAGDNWPPGFPVGLPELTNYFDRHQLPQRGRDLVVHAVTHPPVRRVGGGAGNVVVRYASMKMGCVVQAESRSVELAFVEGCEHDPRVRFYLCQPLSLEVRAVNAKGHRSRRQYVPDFLVLDDDGFALIECKPVSKLEKDALRPSPRFKRDASGWSYPAAQEAAAEFGLQHRVFTSEDVNEVRVRNMRFLVDFCSVDSPDESALSAVEGHLRNAGSICARELLSATQAPAEVLWWLVAHGRVFADLERQLLFSDVSVVHSSPERMLADRAHRDAASDAPRYEVGAFRADPGCNLLWDGEPWLVVNRGVAGVSLQHEQKGHVVVLSVDNLAALVRSGAIRSAGSPEEDEVVRRRAELFRSASNKDLSEALRRHKALLQFDADGVVPTGESQRSLRRYRRWAREGERLFGSPLAGLIRRRGRRPGTYELDPAQRGVLDEVVEKYAGDTRAGRTSAAYARLTALCEERKISPPKRETLRLALKRGRVSAVVRSRQGARAAYQVSGPVSVAGEGLPARADRVFETAHIDHTPLAVKLVSSSTGGDLGSPWLSFMLDDRSRFPLAAWISFDEPSRASLLQLLYDCISRHGRVPDNVVVDQGSDFNSNDFEIALAELRVNKLERPTAAPRFGSVIERWFGINDTEFIHELDGNTKLSHLGRRLSSTHRPSRLAAWTLARLHERCERWLFDVYPTLVHGQLGAAPRDAFEHGLAVGGVRAARSVSLTHDLRILLSQTPQGGPRAVHPVRGITIDYLHYWHDDLGLGDVAGSKVEVKVDPLDCTVVFAYVGRRWITCRLADGDADLAGRTRKQIRLAIDELQAQRRAGARGRDINARILGRFLLETDAQGKLARQVRRDAERRLVDPSRPSSGPVAADAPALQPVQGPFPTPKSEDPSPVSAPPSSSSLSAVPDDDDPLSEVLPVDLVPGPSKLD